MTEKDILESIIRKGYARVSTGKQKTDRQVESLKKIGCVKIYEEKISGAVRERPELEKLLSEIEPGDEIWIHELSRFSRSLKDLLELVSIIQEKGASLHSISEKWFDTSDDNPSANLLLNIFASLAQFEREMTLQRQREGIEIAKRKGKYKGRKPVWKDDPKTNHALRLFQDGEMAIKEITQVTGIPKTSLYRIAKERGVTRSEM